MPKQNVATPRFFINEALYSQVQGDYRHSILELNPSNRKTFSNQAITLNLDYNPTYIMLLGNSAGFELSSDVEIPVSSVLLINEGSQFADTLWGLFTELIKHRVWHWKRGDGWVD